MPVSSVVSRSLFELILVRSRVAFILGLPLCFTVSAFFLLLPELDLLASGVFFNPSRMEDGTSIGFWLRHNETLGLSFVAVDMLSRIVLLCLLGLLVIRIIRRHEKMLSTLIVTLSLIFGPVIVVNGVLKEHWDRARPRDLKEFGGNKQFTPAWIKSDQCDRNCSFTSGHAAAGFSFIVIYFVASSRVWLLLSLFCGGLIGWTRIAVGAHFLSDVIISFFMVYLITAAVAWAVVSLAPTAAKTVRV